MIVQGKVLSSKYKSVIIGFHIKDMCSFLFKKKDGEILKLKAFVNDIDFEPGQWVKINEITLEINKNNTVIEFWK